MKREDFSELHFITAVENVPSILKAGILSHKLSARVPHTSVAKEGVQGRRADIRIPGGQPLHDYANVYFHARNPMMFYLQGMHANLCVLRLDCAILDVKGVVISDQNAARGNARFSPSPGGLARLDRDLVFAQWWTDPDPMEKERKKAAKCAEVLVPGRIPPEFIKGAFVLSDSTRARLIALAPGLSVEINVGLFFQ